MCNGPSDPPTHSEAPPHESIASAAATMAKPPSLTLILAATPALGIGKSGGLPWPQLKKEMGYFARVTKRVPVSPASSSQPGPRRINAVLMGRKTWESIPRAFRPLKDRVNIVVTRAPDEFSAQLEKTSGVEGPVVASGVGDALAKLEMHGVLSGAEVEIERVFVIGGASVYQAALELPQTRRVLLTKIHRDFDCDTFFPIDLEETTSWRKGSRDELREYTGEEMQEGGVEEQGVKFEFCLYEREGMGSRTKGV